MPTTEATVDGYFVAKGGARTTRAGAEEVEDSAVPHSLSRTEGTGNTAVRSRD